MMNRWTYRIIIVVMLLIFGLVFLQMYKTLVALQQQNVPVTRTST